MLVSEPIAAVLIRRASSGSLHALVQSFGGQHGFRLGDTGRVAGDGDNDEVSKVDFGVSRTVGEEYGDEEPEAAYGWRSMRRRRIKPDTDRSIWVGGARLLRMVGEGYPAIDFYHGLDAEQTGQSSAPRQPQGKAPKRVAWESLASKGNSSLRLSASQASGSRNSLSVPERNASNEIQGNQAGLEDTMGIATVISGFGSGIVDLKDAFDSCSVLPGGRRRSKSDESHSRVLELAAVGDCMAKLGIGVLASNAVQLAKSSGLARSSKVVRSQTGRVVQTDSISFDAFLRLIHGVLSMLVKQKDGILPDRQAGLPWIRDWLQTHAPSSRTSSQGASSAPVQPVPRAIPDPANDRDQLLDDLPHSPTRSTLSRVFRTFATHVTNGVGIALASLP